MRFPLLAQGAFTSTVEARKNHVELERASLYLVRNAVFRNDCDRIEVAASPLSDWARILARSICDTPNIITSMNNS